MAQITTNGVVLRQRSMDQDDHLLSILTAECGVVTAYCKGSKRPQRHMASSTELLCYSNFVLFHNKEKYYVDKADSLRVFFGIRQDLNKLALASYFAQLGAELIPTGEKAELYLKLMLNTLHLLEKGERSFSQLKALFELRLLTMTGYMPNLVGCRICGSFEADTWQFFPKTGEIECESCRQPESEPGIPLPAGVLAAMRHIIYAPDPRLFAFSLSPEGLLQLERLSELYLRHQTERSFSALEFYRSLVVADV